MSKKQDPKAAKVSGRKTGDRQEQIPKPTLLVAVQAPRYGEAVKATILHRIALGEGLNAICSTKGMPDESTVREWVIDNVDGFAPKYARARDMQAEHFADELTRLSDQAMDTESAACQRLKIDTRKWIISKILPKKYGDTLDLTTAGESLAKVRVIRPAAPNGK